MQFVVAQAAQLIAKLRIRSRPLEHSFKERFKIERRTAGGDQGDVPVARIGDHLIGQLDESGDGERLIRLDNVDQVVSHELTLSHGWLGRTDIHAAIDLHGINAKDLGAHRARQFEGQLAFTGCGRSDDD